ncbi:PQQ-binding-like beta-propeller repeat protein [Candidatus Dependentiae bacterium]|nr:PQQ-binding-like beta-propeller repeat protein [Candidatus Dependentiae bacterium]
MKNYSLIVVSLALFFIPGSVYPMNSEITPIKQLEIDFRSLPVDIQKLIVLSNDTFIFMGEQPIITLGGTNGHTDRIISVALTSNRIVTASSDKTAKIWDRDTGHLLSTLKHPNCDILMVKTSGSNVITESRDTTNDNRRIIKIWDLHTGKLLHELYKECHLTSAPHSFLEVSNDKMVILSDKESTKIQIREIHTGAIVHEIEQTDPITLAALSGDTLAIVSRGGTIKLSDIASGNCFYRAQYSGQITCIALSNNKLAIGSHHATTKIGRVKIVDATTGKVITLGEAHSFSGPIKSVTIHDNKVISKSSGGTTKTWDIHTGELLLSIERTLWNRPVALTDTKEIVIQWNGTATLWDLQEGIFLRTLICPNGHTGEITGVAASHNHVVTISHDTTAKIWPLSLNLQEPQNDKPVLPEGNPLLWIIKKTDIAQLNFIQRAYEATSAQKEFVIDLPKNFSTLGKHESQEQADGRIYFSFPQIIRDYLRNRLTLRRAANRTEKASNNCLIQ